MLPSSPDNLFPSKAERPFYLFRMLGLGTRFSGIVADLFDKGPQQARADFEGFRTQYAEVSKMVPEWKKHFPMGPLEEFAKASATEDRGKIMAAHEKVGMVCHNCHAANTPIVQQKYHWGDFYASKVKAPQQGGR